VELPGIETGSLPGDLASELPVRSVSLRFSPDWLSAWGQALTRCDHSVRTCLMISCRGIPGEQLAEAAGLSVPRVYQIRDGRR
jgi:hypothetical protein